MLGIRSYNINAHVELSTDTRHFLIEVQAIAFAHSLRLPGVSSMKAPLLISTLQTNKDPYQVPSTSDQDDEMPRSDFRRRCVWAMSSGAF